MKHLLKLEYPNLKNSEYKKVLSFIDGKYSQYYFLDYMRCSNGNVDDAIRFSILDEKLRTLLFQNIICFETQLKSDFVICVNSRTHCSNFWKKKKFYMPDAVVPRSKGKNSKYFLTKRRLEEGVKRLQFDTIGPQHLVAMYTCSFGTFIQLFKIIGKDFKKEFISKYSKIKQINNYKILCTYFEAIRILRNRCAHGNHLVSTKVLHELNKFKHVIGEEKTGSAKKVIEKTLIFMFNNSYCGKKFKNNLLHLLNKYSDLLLKYPNTHSIPNVFYKHT